MKKLRVIAYSCNGTGMGHITRTMAISRRIRTLAKTAGVEPEIFVLTSSEAANVANREKFVSFKIPSPNAIKAQLPGFLDEYRDFDNDFRGPGQRISLSIMEELRPDVLIVDNSTQGYLREFVVSDILERVNTAVFIYRERRDEKATPGFLEHMSKYDVIIAPHSSDTRLIVPDGLEDRLHRVGNIMIRDKTEALDRKRVQLTHQMDPDKLNIYVTAGGGGDKKHNSTLQKIISGLGDVGIYVGLGNLHKGNIPTFEGKARVLSHYPMMELFNGFDVAISAAGYNTVSELLHMGVPAILYPQLRNVDDQEKRVRDLHEAGAVVGIDDISQVGEAFAPMRNPAFRAQLREAAMATVTHNGAWTAAYRIVENIFTDAQLKSIKDKYSDKIVL